MVWGGSPATDETNQEGGLMATKAQINNKIRKLQEIAEEITDLIEERINELEDKVAEIEAKADDRESGENTEGELAKIDLLNEEIDALNDKKDGDIYGLVTGDIEELE